MNRSGFAPSSDQKSIRWLRENILAPVSFATSASEFLEDDMIHRGQHSGRALVVHQNNVNSGFDQAIHALLDHAVEFGRVGMAHRAVGSDLPDDQLRMNGDHVGVEAGQFLGRVLSADSSINDRELSAGSALLSADCRIAG